MKSTRKRMVGAALLTVALGGGGLGVAAAAPSSPEAMLLAGVGGGWQQVCSSVDYWFAVHMADHHQDAVDMADLASQRSGRQEVGDLAGQISRTQTDEIAALQAAAQRLRPADDSSRPRMGRHGGGMGMGGGHRGGMGGMHAGGQADLRTLSGEQFDRAFLEQMIEHHQMGVHMARRELRGGTDAQVRDLAAAMLDVQTREIQLMQDWLRVWFGAPPGDL